MKQHLLVVLFLLTLTVHGQSDDPYVPGEWIRIDGSLSTSDGSTLSSAVIEVYIGETKIGRFSRSLGDNTYYFEFCSNNMEGSDSILTIVAIYAHPKYYRGSLTAKYKAEGQYDLILSHIPEKDSVIRPRCGTDEYTAHRNQVNEDYKNNEPYRHCDGTIWGFQKLKDSGQWTSEWKRITPRKVN